MGSEIHFFLSQPRDSGIPRGQKSKIDSINNSVGRCKAITHGLLGFTRHIKIHRHSLNRSGLDKRQDKRHAIDKLRLPVSQ